MSYQPKPGEHERFRGEHPVVVEGLKTQFGEHVVHNDLSLKVNRGEILGVVGGSGTGKSVLMRAIIGLQTAAAGDIEVFGRSIFELFIPETLLLQVAIKRCYFFIHRFQMMRKFIPQIFQRLYFSDDHPGNVIFVFSDGHRQIMIQCFPLMFITSEILLPLMVA